MVVVLLVAVLFLSTVPALVAAADGEEPNLSPIKLPEKGNPKLDSQLNQLVSAQMRDQAMSFAEQGNIALVGESVRISAEGVPGQLDAAREAATALGASIETSYRNLLQVVVPVANLLALAEVSSISFIRLPYYSLPLVTSEGVGLINADDWQAAGYTGAGVKVGILDLGFSGYTTRQSAGELPATVTTWWAPSLGGPGTEVHGTGCAEIVYDIAPDAQLYLANYATEVEKGNAVDWLIAQGVNVISSSTGSFIAGPGDGTGIFGEMVDNARNAGILWSQAMGNHAQRHWQGGFVNVDADDYHEFFGADETNNITVNSGSLIVVQLKWDDPWGASANDYDLLLFNNALTLVAVSSDTQNGNDTPVESLGYVATYSGTYHIAISPFSSPAVVNFHLYTNYYDLQYQVAAGSFGIPADSPNAMSVGAMPWNNPTTLESFSSRGPTKDGRIKPDLVAPDGVSTVTYGAFYGTSASAPHAAGAAALVKERYPSYTPSQIQAYLETNAIDLGDAGKDNLYGSGRLYLLPLPDIAVSPSSINFGSVTVGSSSSPQTVTVSNDGNASLTIGTITKSGTQAAQFSIQNDNASGQTLSPSANATLQVVFSPTSGGAKSATLAIASNDPDEPTVSVSLNGTGFIPPAPEITVSPSSLDFSWTLINTSSSPQTVTVTNDGNANLSIGAVFISGTHASLFSLQSDNASNQTLSPGANAIVRVVFSPTTITHKSATLSIPSDDSDEGLVNVALSGIGKVAPTGVGGEIAPINRTGVLAFWLGLALTLALAIGAGGFTLRRRQSHQV